MMKIKKWISFGLLFIVCFGGLTGCSLFSTTTKDPDRIEKEVDIVEIQSTITETYKTISSGCVGIYATSSESGSVGSGVVYKENNGVYYVVTNHHVIEDMSTVRIYRGGSKYYKASVLGSDPKNDIAVLTFSLDLFGGTDIYIQDIFNYEDDIVTVGQSVMAIGCPLGLENFNTLTTGVVSRVTSTQIQTNAEINPGNSGGGLFNTSGRLIGINTSKEVYTTSYENGVQTQIPVEGLGYAISLDVVKKCITDIEQKKAVISRPLLGITILAVNRYLSSKETEAYISLLPNSMDAGVIVTDLIDGVAHKAGIHVNDVIVKANGEEILIAEDLSNILNLLLAGDTIELEIYRSSTQTTMTIVITLE